MRCGTGTGRREGSTVRPGVVIGMIGMVMLGGCGTPPAVVPLMRSAQQTLEQERELLAADGERRAQRFEQQRAALRSGYEADLASRERIDPAWVMEGTRAYVTAREALLRQEMELAQQTGTRQRNLSRAAGALERAAGLIRRQDQLLGPADPWGWLERQDVLMERRREDER